MPIKCPEFLERCLLFDIEDRIYSIGAIFNNESICSPARKKVDKHFLAEFDQFGADAQYILGHNILGHDIPRLREVSASLEILQKPAIDTLYLSPLAFPENRCHRLVKDYLLVRDSINDPAQDARTDRRCLAGTGRFS